ncbi:DoxX family protein [Kaistia granuli]|uniref:DoxX family protein n=1 Tax=Kaistia granuli TaxID=363259 RepID=UPI0003687B02|nr:DoxX family protein [Kaistia granuli]
MNENLSRMPVLRNWQPEILALLRIATALVYLQFGTAKLLGFPFSDTLSNLPPFSLFWIAGIFEIIGAPLLLIGLFTGPVAFVLSGEMAIAYFFIHLPEDFFPLRNGGIEAILFCFIFFYLAAAGPGAWSVDMWLARRRRFKPGPV